MFFVFLLKISSVEDDESMLVKVFHKTLDKGFVMINLEYTITRKDVQKKIPPPVIRHISKSCGWVIFKDNLNVSSDSYSDFSI